MRPITSLLHNPPQYVIELIHQSTGDWNRELVHNTIIDFDAGAILAIPLCTRAMGDFWSWSHHSKGIFTVRSAYRMLVFAKHWCEAWLEGRGDYSNADAEQRSWCKLWKVQVPSKIRIFLWRHAQQSIPSTDLIHH